MSGVFDVWLRGQRSNMSGSRVTCVKVKGLGHVRIPKKGRWAHKNVGLNPNPVPKTLHSDRYVYYNWEKTLTISSWPYKWDRSPGLHKIHLYKILSQLTKKDLDINDVHVNRLFNFNIIASKGKHTQKHSHFQMNIWCLFHRKTNCIWNIWRWRGFGPSLWQCSPQCRSNNISQERYCF